MIYRNITSQIKDALSDSPVVLLNGARQSGKSTLVKKIASEIHSSQYLTLDDDGILAAAKHDPAGFIGELDGDVVIDEVQRVPDLFLAIKAEVDRDRRPGRFLRCRSAPCGLRKQKSYRSKNVVICHQNWSICLIPNQKVNRHNMAPDKAL